jgi:membrane protease YdiL (CAAX protease family)
VNTINRLADNRSLLLALAVLIVWILLTLIIASITAYILETPIASVVSQSIGTLSATGILLLLASRLGWLNGIGVTRFGTWTTWLLTLLISIYITYAYLYSYFGELDYRLADILQTQVARQLLLRQLVVGFVEETLFRGFILYILVRGWGKNRSGILAAILVQAALFGLLHSLQVYAGSPTSTVLLNVLGTFVFGIWLGALVLIFSTIWPAIFLHMLANFVPLSKGLYSAWINPVSLQYTRDILFELPLELITLWVIWKAAPMPTTASQKVPEPETSL